MKDDLQFLRLWDMYSSLLTATQREITDLYFNYDLSLAEIAEQKGVSRQSVSDCLQKSRKQMEIYENKLGFLKTLDEISQEYSAYMTETERWMEKMRQNGPQWQQPIDELKTRLQGVHEQFGVEIVDLDEE